MCRINWKQIYVLLSCTMLEALSEVQVIRTLETLTLIPVCICYQFQIYQEKTICRASLNSVQPQFSYSFGNSITCFWLMYVKSGQKSVFWKKVNLRFSLNFLFVERFQEWYPTSQVIGTLLLLVVIHMFSFSMHFSRVCKGSSFLLEIKGRIHRECMWFEIFLEHSGVLRFFTWLLYPDSWQP